MSVLITGLVSCARKTGPTSAELSSAYYGPYPDEYQKIIKDYYENTLFDPYSAKYKFGTPHKSWMWVSKKTQFGIDYTNSTAIGWAVEYAINGKNRMGGYTGFTKYKAILVDGKIIVVGKMLY